jgi:hypothetical protein
MTGLAEVQGVTVPGRGSQLRRYRTAYDEKTKTFSDTPHRDWTTDIADAARYMAVVAREIAPPPPPKSERPPGISMSDMTMDEFMDLEEDRGARETRFDAKPRPKTWDPMKEWPEEATNWRLKTRRADFSNL